MRIKSFNHQQIIKFIIVPFSARLLTTGSANQKVLDGEPGIINSIKFKISPDIGRLLENLVAIELLRREE